jgi:glycosyltransferase involved in cell wall biosynthesis
VSPNIRAVPDPLVSVVVCTFNRPARLSALLDSLAAQMLSADSFEVVVVDEASGPSTVAVLGAAGERSELSLRSIRHERPLGPSAARNAGWRAARAPLIAFTDDDCTADPGWLSAGLAAHAAEPEAIIQGRTDPDPAERANGGLLSRSVTVAELGPRYETCNIFYPRAALESLDGFDEAFGRRPAAEDMDLAWRAIERGWRTEFAPDARILHAVEPLGALGMLRVALRWTPAIRVFSEHPQTRVMLYRGLFWNVWHYLLWRSLAAALGPRWLRRMLLTMHLLELRKRARVAGAGASSIPFLIVHDLVECWAIARGAVRYRTLVL